MTFYQDPGARLVVLATGPVSAYIIAIRHRLAARDWFHPWVFAVAYTAFVLLTPALFLVLFNEPLTGLVPARVTTTLVLVFHLTLIGLAVGIGAGLRMRLPQRAGTARELNYERLRLLGRFSLAVAILPRTYTVVSRFGKAYGQDQFYFGVDKTLDNLAVALFLVGVILVVVANVRLSGRLVGNLDIALAGAFVLVTLGSGGRGELIAPAFFIIWAHHTWLRRVRLATVVVVVLVVALLFQGVSGTRQGQPFWAGSAAAAERTLTAVGVPLQVTSDVIANVPDPFPYRRGDTYAASVKRQLPSPLAIRLFGTPDDTGSFVIRRVTGFDDPNQGQGFALPAEAYLNFGVPGALLAGLVLGALLGLAYRQSARWPSRGTHLFYPVLLTSVPYGLRADALAQIKLVLYPMLLLGGAFWLSRTLAAPTPVAPEPVAAPPAGGSARPRRYAAATMAAALLAPALVLLYSAVGREPIVSAAVARSAVESATGVPLRVSSPFNADVGIEKTFVGGDRAENFTVVVCYSEAVARRLTGAAPPARQATFKFTRRANVIVFYSRAAQVRDRFATIRSAVGGLDPE